MGAESFGSIRLRPAFLVPIARDPKIRKVWSIEMRRRVRKSGLLVLLGVMGLSLLTLGAGGASAQSGLEDVDHECTIAADGSGCDDSGPPSPPPIDPPTPPSPPPIDPAPPIDPPTIDPPVDGPAGPECRVQIAQSSAWVGWEPSRISLLTSYEIQIRTMIDGVTNTTAWLPQLPVGYNIPDFDARSDLKVEIRSRNNADGIISAWNICRQILPPAPTCSATSTRDSEVTVQWEAPQVRADFEVRLHYPKSGTTIVHENLTSRSVTLTSPGGVEVVVSARGLNYLSEYTDWLPCGTLTPASNPPAVGCSRTLSNRPPEARRFNWDSVPGFEFQARWETLSGNGLSEWKEHAPVYPHMSHSGVNSYWLRNRNVATGAVSDWVSCGSFVDPIVVDLDGGGVTTTSLEAANGHTFDLIGTGEAVESGWVAPGEGFLARDLNGNGTIDGLNELFGGELRGEALEQLAALDSNNNGQIDANDDQWSTLSIWTDLNGNRLTDPGELKTLDHHDIVGFGLTTTGGMWQDAAGNIQADPIRVSRGNGNNTIATDIFLSYED